MKPIKYSDGQIIRPNASLARFSDKELRDELQVRKFNSYHSSDAEELKQLITKLEQSIASELIEL